MGKLYDGKLTAWLTLEAEKILKPIVPPQSKFYEGTAGVLEIKSLTTEYKEAREAMIALAREYAERERECPPVEVNGPVHHGFEDD